MLTVLGGRFANALPVSGNIRAKAPTMTVENFRLSAKTE